MDLHDIARDAARLAGADFAFVLSQAGLLVTKDAPREMPDRGRMKILWACPAGKNGEVTHLEMPREDLVPFGGAAPVDVFAVRVEDTAILACVLSTWNDKGNVVLAMTSGASSLGEMIRKAKRARVQRLAVAAEGPPPAAQRSASKKGVEAPSTATQGGETPPKRAAASGASTNKKERTSAAAHVSAKATKRDRPSASSGAFAPAQVASQARKDRTSALPKSPKESASKKPIRTHSEPEIVVGEAALGRETLFAIEGHLATTLGATSASALSVVGVGSQPEIVVGEAAVGRETLFAIDAASPHAPAGPAPEGIRVQLDSVGRETMLEIAQLEADEMERAPTVDEPLIVSQRKTLPWVDTASALKRTVDAKAKARAMAAPEVKVSVEEMDPEALLQALREDKKR